MKFTKTKFKIPGYSQLFLETTCTLNCKNCCVFDYHGKSCIKDRKRMTLNSVNNLMTTLDNKGIKFENLAILGGEPTLNPQFTQISKSLRNNFSHLYNKLYCHTNGTNLTTNVVKGLTYYDDVNISIYPSNIDIRTTLINSKIIKYLRKSRVNVIFKMYTMRKFYVYGKTIKHVKYDENNWDRCPIKNTCQYITQDGNIYGCVVLFAEKGESCNLLTDSVEKIKEYFNTPHGFERCKTCWHPTKREAIKSLKPDVDKKNVNIGVKIIKEFNQ